MKEKFNFSKEVKEAMVNEIKNYYETERKESIGDLAALLILEFFSEKLGPHFYNKGVQDSYSYMSNKLEELYEIEKK